MFLWFFMGDAMRKLLVAVLFILTLSVTACAPEEKDPLYYQSEGAHVSGTLLTDTGTFYIKLTLYPSTSDEYVPSLRDAVIEFTYPDTLKGYAVRAKDGHVTLSSGELSLPISEEASVRFRDIIGLFSIDGGLLYSVSNDADGYTTLLFDTDEKITVTLITENSLPTVIERGDLTLKIDEYLPAEVTETSAETSET